MPGSQSLQKVGGLHGAHGERGASPRCTHQKAQRRAWLDVCSAEILPGSQTYAFPICLRKLLECDNRVENIAQGLKKVVTHEQQGYNISVSGESRMVKVEGIQYQEEKEQSMSFVFTAQSHSQWEGGARSSCTPFPADPCRHTNPASKPFNDENLSNNLAPIFCRKHLCLLVGTAESAPFQPPC